MDDEDIRDLYRRFNTMIAKRVPEIYVEDLIQDSVIEAWIHRGEVQNKDYFPGWSASIARHHVADHVRHAKAGARMLETVRNESRLLPGHDEQDHFAFEFADAIEKLPDREREILYLYLIEGFSMPEIAAMLGITSGSAWYKYKRAKKRLAKRWRR